MENDRGSGKLLSRQILQRTINEMKEIVAAELSLWNAEGKIAVKTSEADESAEEKVRMHLSGWKEQMEKDAEEISESIEEEAAFFPILNHMSELEYVLLIQGAKDDIKVIGRLCVSQIRNLITAYHERMDKNNFLQNLLLDNFLLVDIYNRAKKLGIAIEERRVVFLIEPKKEGDSIVMETMRGLYATGTKDFITAVDEGHIIFIKHLEVTDGYQEINDVAKTITDTLSAEAMMKVRVAYGTVVEELKDVSKSYKEASMALDVGRIFYSERTILAYNELGIGRLIHQLPVSLCEMFLQEVFNGDAFEQFDEETLVTVYKFFDNNLNVSETARQLYIHRNTLVYRLEKIQKSTGLDVRVFDDALTFKIAMMVASHIKK